ncbi:hypothetical protein L226DRAFT_612843 [Lentinus tigrinus ALCF2SS1-7]|uniref:Uncharacterized protein n=1 Tax=Lentinus tigrinus ALCF2SS1-6 TaxID=1328759 RepID=A0A5C2SBC4_9APHY|nr:hypothetical protein L227DRAFT_652894 [Lentinus tigrinus ALCF2SS1-6]RPD75200.1 hypothetical protein L226DRAFT_612843 [Lentinus tigrinus ALCF2SS1-7]
MLSMICSAINSMHSPSSHAPSSRPSLLRACSLSLPSQPLPSARCRPRAPSSTARSRSGTPSTHWNPPVPDDDEVVCGRERLDTSGDPRLDKAYAEKLKGHQLSPIGSPHGSKTRPSSPVGPAPVSASSQSGYFPPPGLVEGWPPNVDTTNHPADKNHVTGLDEDEFEAKFVSMDQICKPRQPKPKPEDQPDGPKRSGGALQRKLVDILRQRPYFGSYACPIECTGFRCANCKALKFSGNLLAAKIGQRTANARLLRVTPHSEWPYVEDRRKVLRLQDSYRRGSERALAELSLQYWL